MALPFVTTVKSWQIILIEYKIKFSRFSINPILNPIHSHPEAPLAPQHLVALVPP